MHFSFTCYIFSILLSYDLRNKLLPHHHRLNLKFKYRTVGCREYSFFWVWWGRERERELCTYTRTCLNIRYLSNTITLITLFFFCVTEISNRLQVYMGKVWVRCSIIECIIHKHHMIDSQRTRRVSLVKTNCQVVGTINNRTRSGSDNSFPTDECRCFATEPQRVVRREAEGWDDIDGLIT